MRPILYSADETKFTSMGYGRLTECTSCYCEEERNGIFEVTFKYPTSGQLYKYISEGCYIKVKANDKQDLQIFKIYGSSKEINGEQEFYCEHISYRLNRIPLIGADIQSKTAKEAMNQLKSESLIQNDFTFESDIDSSLNSTIKVPVSVRKALGGVEGSILDTWGGEFEWDNMTVKLWKQRGESKDLPIKYGLNLQKLNKKKSIDVVYTSVLPYVTYTDDDNVEHKITLSEKYLTYEEITVQELSIYVKDFSDQFSEGESKTEDTLRTKCKQWMKTNKLYMPSISLSVEIVKLEQTEEYKDLLKLQSVNLCDYVPVVFEDLGVSEKIQVIKIKYDCLNERNDTIELGDKVSTLNEQVLSNSESSSNQIDKITQGYLDAIANATELITGNKGGHVVFRPGTKPEEILVMDTDNINTAKNVWRWNQSGLGHSSNGYEGPYDTAITMDGSIVAKFIAAGVLTGMQLKGGSININNKFIVDSQGNVHVDGDGYFKGNIEGSNISGGNIKGSNISGANITGGNINGSVIDTSENINVGTYAYLNNQGNSAISGVYIKYQGKVYTAIYQNVGQSATLITTSGNLFLEAEQAISIAGTEIYLSSQPIVGSDRRLKEDFVSFDERYIELFEKLKPTLYRLKALPKEKSKLAGFIAQEVEEAMKACGIEKREFGIYKYDEENDSYSLVYEMFIPLLVYYIQTKEQDFENRLSKIERMFR